MDGRVAVAAVTVHDRIREQLLDEQRQPQAVATPDGGPGAGLLDERADAIERITMGRKYRGVRPFGLSFHLIPEQLL